MRSIILIAAAMGGIGVATPALAENSADRITQNRAVAYDDLDLGTKRGVAKLNMRIGLALDAVCGTYTDPDQAVQDDIGRCRKAARAALAPRLALLMQRQPVALASFETK